MMQAQYLQWIIEKVPSSGGVKTNPIQTQFKANNEPKIRVTNPNKPNFQCISTGLTMINPIDILSYLNFKPKIVKIDKGIMP